MIETTGSYNTLRFVTVRLIRCHFFQYVMLYEGSGGNSVSIMTRLHAG